MRSIDALLGPASQLRRLALRQIRLHRKVGLRQIDGFLVVHSRRAHLDSCAENAARLGGIALHLHAPSHPSTRTSAHRAAARRIPLRARDHTDRRRNRTGAPRAAASRRRPSAACPGSPPPATARAGPAPRTRTANTPASGTRRRLTGDVGGRKTKRAAELVAVPHPAAHAIGPAQQPLRAWRNRRSPRACANPAAADALAVDSAPARVTSTSNPNCAARSRTPLGIRLAAAAEAKIMSDHHHARARRAQQLHELQRPTALAARSLKCSRHSRVEPAALTAVASARENWSAARADRPAAGTRAAAARSSPSSPAAASRAACCSSRCDQRLMAQMQAIEAADRDDAIARLDDSESADELHDPLRL